RILVEGTQVGVQPVGTTHTGNQGQVGRRSAEPGLGILQLHTDLHVIADLGTGEYQVLHHQLVRNADVVGNPLVALELGTVATHAVVGEGTRTILQGGLVGQIDIDFIQRNARGSGKGQGRQCSEYECSK